MVAVGAEGTRKPFRPAGGVLNLVKNLDVTLVHTFRCRSTLFKLHQSPFRVGGLEALVRVVYSGRCLRILALVGRGCPSQRKGGGERKEQGT